MCVISMTLQIRIYHIHAGKEPWANLLALINEKSTADLDIKAKAMSLINRVSPCHDYVLHITHHH